MMTVPIPRDDTALMAYLAGDDAVRRAASELCSAAALLTAVQSRLEDANSVLVAALEAAGIRAEDCPEISCAFVFLHHYGCWDDHNADDLISGKGNARHDR